MKPKIRVAVIGAGQFGRNHCRVVDQSTRADLTAIVDSEPGRAAEATRTYQAEALADWRELEGRIDAAVVAVPTSAHAEVGCGLMEAGIDVLLQKPIASDLAASRPLLETAERYARILQIGHLERF